MGEPPKGDGQPQPEPPASPPEPQREPPEPQREPPEPQHDPIDEARDIVDDAVGRVRDLGALLGSIHSRYLLGVLLIYAATAALGTAIVVIHPFRDWFMFLAMWLVILAFLLLYVKGHYRRTPVAKIASLFTSLLLMVFWGAVLYDRIPGRRVWIGNEVVTQPDLPILWAPIAGLAVVALGLLVHWTVIGRHHWAARPP